MFRRFAIVLIAAALVPSVYAAKRLTVDQLQGLLTNSHNKSDAELAYQVAALEMGQRISDKRLAALEESLPGPQSRSSLQALADESQFLDLPPDELLSTPTPAPDDQRQIMSRILTYIAHVIPQLPNFFATRQTVHFVETPAQYDMNDNLIVHYQPLHVTSASSRSVSYQDGKEVAEQNASQPAEASNGLRSWGEFGPILATVVVDAAKGKVAWSHWEQGQDGPIAVYSYSVPKDSSQFEIDYCCVPDSGQTHLTEFREKAGYHGEIAADASTGAILRLTVISELKSSDEISLADIVVAYGPVDIGGKSYICPIRSIALSNAKMALSHQQFLQMASKSGPGSRSSQQQILASGAVDEGPEQTLLNDVSFNSYHVLRSDAQLVADNDVNAAGAPGVADNSTSAATGASVAAPAQPAGAPVPASSTPASAASAEASAPAAPPTPAPAPEPPEFSVTPATGLPDFSTQPQISSPNHEPTIRTTARSVDVDVVVFDKKGHPITDLKQSDFQIFDSGRQQTIRSFSQDAAANTTASTAAPASALPAPDDSQQVFSNREEAPAAQKTTATTTILLIDSSHLAFSDLANARSEMVRFLKTVPADERVGLYVLRRFGFQVLKEPTVDHNDLATALNKWMPTAQDLAQAQDEEQRNRQDIEYVHSVTDLLYVNGNTPTGEGDMFAPVDPQLRGMGDNPPRAALASLISVARHLAAIPGHKSLIWVSSDNVLADFSDKAPDAEKGDHGADTLEIRAREALNEAHGSIYPLDASQLEAGGISASTRQNNVQLNPASVNPYSQTAGLPPSVAEEANEAYEKSQRDMYPGRITSQMQQDTHPIQGMFQDLAIATGGRTLRRAGDIAGELNGVVADGRAVYMLSFTPDSQPDNKYHDLNVKVAGKRDVKLRFRSGYFYAVEPATMKDRFQQALWQPADSTELTITATPLAGVNGPELRLNIGGAGLDLAQQGDRYVDDLQVFFLQQGGSAGRARIAGQVLHLDLKAATYQDVLRDGVPFRQTLELRKNIESMRVLVVDKNSGRIGSVTIPASALQ
ncbi:MAG TPA: VWA domain-containing protein [Terracidiphilus sp.]|nr:VWA domain-containing protein [Terracidiphilus sp.]